MSVRRDLARASAALPRCAAAVALCAVLLLGHGAPADAALDVERSYAQLALGDVRGLETTLRQHLDTDDTDAGAWLLLGKVLLESTDLANSQLAFERAIELSPDTSMEAHASLAEIALLQVETDAAAAHANAVLATMPADLTSLTGPDLRAAASAATILGRRDTGRLREAVDYLNQAIENDGNDVASRVELARLLLSKYNNTEASEQARGALAVDGANPHAMLQMAHSLAFDHAAQTPALVARILEAHPDFVHALNLQAKLRLDAEDYAGALASVRDALVRNPRSRQAMTLLAGLYFLRGEQARAEAVVDDLRAGAEGYIEVYQTLAELAERNRRYAEAAELALIALNIDSQAWRSHATLGINRSRIGQQRIGRRNLEVAFRGDPFNVRVKNTLDLFDKIDREFEREVSENFVLLGHAREMGALAPLALPLAEQAFRYYRERYQHTPKTPIHIEIYPQHEDFSVRTSGVTGIGILGVSFGRVIALDSPSARAFGPLNWGSVLWHEIAHSFHLSMTRHRMPRWFSEGLAVYEERRARTGWGADLSPDFVKAWAAGELPQATRMNETFLRPKSQQQLVHGYFQASLFIEFLTAEDGFDAVLKLLDGFAEGTDFNALVREALNLPPDELDRRFEAFLKTRLADAVAAMEEQDDRSYGALLRKAGEHLNSDRLAAARKGFAEAMRTMPDYADDDSAYWQLANVETQMGDDQAAAATLEAMLAVNADSLAGHRLLSEVYERLGRVKRERDTLERLLFIEPFDVKVHQRLAATYEQEARWEQAAASYRAALTLAPSDQAEAQFRYARALAHTGEDEAARMAVLRALERAPLYDEALELLLELRGSQ
ncbi:MAG: tetratricopeptide repeat protein [Pseudomonadota bacterium]